MPLPTTLTTWSQCCVLHSEETAIPCKAGIWAWSLSVLEGNSFYHHLRNVASNTRCPAIQLSIKTILLNTIKTTLCERSKDYSTQYKRAAKDLKSLHPHLLFPFPYFSSIPSRNLWFALFPGPVITTLSSECAHLFAGAACTCSGQWLFSLSSASWKTRAIPSTHPSL